jgi:hypothetical protein
MGMLLGQIVYLAAFHADSVANDVRAVRRMLRRAGLQARAALYDALPERYRQPPQQTQTPSQKQIPAGVAAAAATAGAAKTAAQEGDAPSGP